MSELLTKKEPDHGKSDERKGYAEMSEKSRRFSRGGVLNILLSLVLAAGLLPVMPGAAAADEPAADLGSVHVTVENTTCPAPDAAWTGKLVDANVALGADSTMMSCVKAAIEGAGKTQVGADNGYISEIEGLAEHDGDDHDPEGKGYSGWMGTLNDWFTNEGYTAYSVANGKLASGDEIRVMYTCTMYDLGNPNNTDRALAGITFSAGTLDKSFAKDAHAYTLTVPEGTTSVKITPTAANKNYQVRTFVGDTLYKRAADVPVTDGATITVKSGYKDLDAANDAPEAVAYTFTVKVGTPAVPELVDSGTSGNAEWKFYSDGSLEISAVEGTDGAMPNFTTSAPAPWDAHKTDITSVVVNQGVTTIGNLAFSGYTNLKSATLPEGITKVGQMAFRETSSLESIVVPASVASYGSSPFIKSGIKSVTVGGSAGKLATMMMFKDCANLETAIIREGVTDLPMNLFWGCTSLREISLPSTLKTIHRLALRDCDNIEQFNCAEGGIFTFEDSMLIKNGNEIAYICKASAAGRISIPEGVEALFDNAFKDCANITGVTLPSTIKTIGSGAFYGCTGMTEVNFPEGITSIGANAFWNCSSIESVHIPGSVKTLGNNVFYNCASLKSVAIDEPANIEQTSWGQHVFSGCINLNSVRLPQNMPAYNSMFENCSSLAELVLPEGLRAINSEPNNRGRQDFNTTGMTSLDKLVFPTWLSDYTEDTLFWQATAGQTISYMSLPGAKTVGRYVLPDVIRILVLPATLESFNATGTNIEVVLFGGTQEQWDAALSDDMKGKLEKDGTCVFFNADGAGEGSPATIVKQPEGKSIFQGIGDSTLSLETTAPEGAVVQYQWYKVKDGVTSRLAERGTTATADTSEAGVAEYYCVVRTIKDGVISEVRSDAATVEVKPYMPADAFEGDGSAEHPWLIKNQADISALGGFVNGGISFEGQTIGLEADVELPAGWVPMGRTIDGTIDIQSGKNLWPFSGTLLGNGHTLTVPAGGKPLIGYVRGAEVRDLNIYGERIVGNGLVNNLEGVGLSGSSIVIDNVTIKAGTNITKSGLLGANVTTNGFAGCSAAFVATVRNCTVEAGVTVGCDGDQSMVGSFAGRMQGTVENCVSHATVKGANYVGGIIATRDNAIGEGTVENCTFDGTVQASGKYAGGIVGGGYPGSAAPNGTKIIIKDCTSTGQITGATNVGGITGGDPSVIQGWGTTCWTIADNFFGGYVSAINPDGYVGGIIGRYASLNKSDDIHGNAFAYGCGASKGIGFVEYVDTSCATHETESGATYMDTSVVMPGIPGITVENMNRTDDPLGADADALCKMIAPAFEVSTAVSVGEGAVPAAVRVGDTVTVDVSVSANYGAAALSGTLDFDPAVFELVSVARGAGLSEGVSFLPAQGAAEALFSFYGNEAAADAEGGIVVATATLKALAAADAATIGVKDATAAIAGDSLDYQATVGSVVTLDVLANALLGDANGNGRVNIVDAQVVYDMATGAYGADYAALALPAGWTRATLLWAANVNGDDAIDAADAFAIQRFVHYGAWA